tara:strand:- start:105 stop:434 length:330 start_codon:yes stop_codon:yes gene_type:complete
MQEGKIIGFKVPIRLHTELKTRLFYDNMPMTKFIRVYIEEYLNKNPAVLEFVDFIKEKETIQNKKKRNKNFRLIEKGREVEELFNLSGEEIEDIYDVIESKGASNHEVY